MKKECKEFHWGALWGVLVERVTLDLQVVNLSSTLGVEPTTKEKSH